MGEGSVRRESLHGRNNIVIAGSHFGEVETNAYLTQECLDRSNQQHKQGDASQNKVRHEGLHQGHILRIILGCGGSKLLVHDLAVFNLPGGVIPLGLTQEQRNNQSDAAGNESAQGLVDLTQQQLATALNQGDDDNSGQTLLHSGHLAVEPADGNAQNDVPDPDKDTCPQSGAQQQHGVSSQVGRADQCIPCNSQSAESICPRVANQGNQHGPDGSHTDTNQQRSADSNGNELKARGIEMDVATVVTQVVVDENDPAFKKPTKPIGGFYDKETAEKIAAEKGFTMVEDAGRGYRRVVASPKPVDVVEKNVVSTLMKGGHVVITVGGGGIPVISKDGRLIGTPAVIDKDFASAKLAELICADMLVILTAVDRVAINWGKPNQKSLEEMSVAEAEQYCREGHFAPGSMLPKVEAAMSFARVDGTAIIASLENAAAALRGESGTRVHA